MKKLLVLLGLAAWVAMIVLLPPKTHPAAGDASAPATAPHGPKARVRPAANDSSSASIQTTKAADAFTPRKSEEEREASTERRREEAREAITAAVITYSAAGVQTIRPYLLDTDPEVRAAARDGMVQLGEADAIPLLRHAASKLSDAQEIASLQEGADLLALPAWSDTEDAATVAAEMKDAFER